MILQLLKNCANNYYLSFHNASILSSVAYLSIYTYTYDDFYYI